MLSPLSALSDDELENVTARHLLVGHHCLYVTDKGRHVQDVCFYDEEGEWFRTQRSVEELSTGEKYRRPTVQVFLAGPARGARSTDFSRGDAFVRPTTNDTRCPHGTHDLYLPAPRVTPIETVSSQSDTGASLIHEFVGVAIPGVRSDGARRTHLHVRADSIHRQSKTDLGQQVDRIVAVLDEFAADGRLGAFGVRRMLKRYDVTITPKPAG